MIGKMAAVTVQDIDHVQIAAPKGCEAAARAFYGGLLSLVEVEKPTSLAGRGGCWFQVGSRQLHIGVEDPFVPAKKAHPAFQVSDLDSLSLVFEEKGLTLKRDEAIEGRRRFYSEDPFGNRLEFIEPAEL